MYAEPPPISCNTFFHLLGCVCVCRHSSATLRRLYDIVNVLISLNLVAKQPHQAKKKPTFKWTRTSCCCCCSFLFCLCLLLNCVLQRCRPWRSMKKPGSASVVRRCPCCLPAGQPTVSVSFVQRWLCPQYQRQHQQPPRQHRLGSLCVRAHPLRFSLHRVRFRLLLSSLCLALSLLPWSLQMRYVLCCCCVLMQCC